MGEVKIPKSGTLKSLVYWLEEYDLHTGMKVDAMEFNRPDIEAAAQPHIDEAEDNLITSLRDFLFANGVYPWPKK